jgi:hypothetical protein
MMKPSTEFVIVPVQARIVCFRVDASPFIVIEKFGKFGDAKDVDRRLREVVNILKFIFVSESCIIEL